MSLPAHEPPDHASGGRAAVKPDESCLRTDSRVNDAGTRDSANEGTKENRMPLDPRPIPRSRRLTPCEQDGSRHPPGVHSPRFQYPAGRARAGSSSEEAIHRALRRARGQADRPKERTAVNSELTAPLSGRAGGNRYPYHRRGDNQGHDRTTNSDREYVHQISLQAGA